MTPESTHPLIQRQSTLSRRSRRLAEQKMELYLTLLRRRRRRRPQLPSADDESSKLEERNVHASFNRQEFRPFPFNIYASRPEARFSLSSCRNQSHDKIKRRRIGGARDVKALSRRKRNKAENLGSKQMKTEKGNFCHAPMLWHCARPTLGSLNILSRDL